MTKEQEIVNMMKATGLATAMLEMINQALLAMFGIENEEMRTTIEKLMTEDKIIERLIVPPYAKHYTIKEIREIKSFYTSDVGKKMVSLSPQIQLETMAEMKVWGTEMAITALAEIEGRSEAEVAESLGI